MYEYGDHHYSPAKLKTFYGIAVRVLYGKVLKITTPEKFSGRYFRRGDQADMTSF